MDRKPHEKRPAMPLPHRTHRAISGVCARLFSEDASSRALRPLRAMLPAEPDSAETKRLGRNNWIHSKKKTCPVCC